MYLKISSARYRQVCLALNVLIHRGCVVHIFVRKPCHYCSTHWGRGNMAAVFQTTFSEAFSWMKICNFRLRFHLFPMVQLTTFQHWIRMTWCLSGDKPFSEPMMIILLTHICVARPQWVKTMVFTYTAPNRYLNQRWRILSWIWIVWSGQDTHSHMSLGKCTVVIWSDYCVATKI